MPKVICVVDDEDQLRTLTARILRSAGFEVHVAANGAEALELMGEHRADLLLTDVAMPVMSGLTLVEQLRGRGVDVPVIFFSGFVHELEQLQVTGAEVIAKPFRRNELLAAVHRRIGAGQQPAEGSG